MKRYAIIVAGGSGSRFGSNTPKQFLCLAGKPVLMHTINTFASLGDVEIIVVLPAPFIEWWSDLCAEHNFTTPHRTVAGGDSRFASVKNALDTIPADSNSLVAIHDGVRPLVSASLIEAAYTKAAECGNAVPATEVTDSIRQFTEGEKSVALVRSTLRAVQTPQTFNVALLKDAYNVPFSNAFTDDASVYEHNGGSIHLIPGEVNNIKITHPNDLVIAEMLMR